MYRIQLQEFEGPLDLLLFFIRRDELDIYDIPIARIADEFLDYVRVLEQIDLDGVGDFIYMAALLISLKARMLLPFQDLNEQGEPVDPRKELVERLLDYIRFKESAQELSEHHDKRVEHFTRGLASGESKRFLEEGEIKLEATLIDLVEALRRLLTKKPDETTHQVARFEYTVEGQQAYLITELSKRSKQTFSRFVERQSKPFIITTFLAVLELARQGRIWITMMSGSTYDFWISRKDKPENFEMGDRQSGVAAA